MRGFLRYGFRLVFAAAPVDNSGMELLGQIQNGVVVFEGNPTLPEGATVKVTLPATVAPVAEPLPETRIVREPGKLPYVTGGRPGTWNLTNEMIAQIFEEEDIEMMKGMLGVPS
jgi:hypothetical protein